MLVDIQCQIRCYTIYGQLHNMSTSEGKAQEIYGTTSATSNTRMELEDINMAFVQVLPCISQGYDSIWVIVGHLMKSDHFIPSKLDTQ